MTSVKRRKLHLGPILQQASDRHVRDVTPVKGRVWWSDSNWSIYILLWPKLMRRWATLGRRYVSHDPSKHLPPLCAKEYFCPEAGILGCGSWANWLTAERESWSVYEDSWIINPVRINLLYLVTHDYLKKSQALGRFQPLTQFEFKINNKIVAE